MKKLIILPIILAVFISTLAISGQYDSYKPDYRAPRWDVKINAFIDQVSALYDYCHTTLDTLAGLVSGLSTLVTNWATTENYLIYCTATPTYVDGDTFTVPGDLTATFPTSRIIHAYCGTDGMKYSTVATSVYAAGTTTVDLSSSVLTANLGHIFFVASRDGLSVAQSGMIFAADYGSPSQTTLENAITAIGASNRTLVVGPGTWSINADLVVPANVAVSLTKGALFEIADTKKLTFNGPFFAGLWQVFDDKNADYDGITFGVGSTQKVFLEWFKENGTPGTTDMTAALQGAINSVGNGAAPISLLNTTYLISDVTIAGNGVAIIADSSGTQAYGGGAILKAAATDSVTLTITGYGFYGEGLLFYGLSGTTERGDDVTSVGINFDKTGGGAVDVDAILSKCGFIYHQDGINLQGRNIRLNNCIFSMSKRGIYIPDDGLADIRGLELYGCRFHSIGKSGTADTAAISIAPGADWQEVVINGFDADDCTTLFSGFASGLSITGGVINKSRGVAIILDATGHTLGNERRNVSIVGIPYWQYNADYGAYAYATTAGGFLKTTGTMNLLVSGCQVSQCGGHGFDIGSNYAKIIGCSIRDVGWVTDNTYNGFNLTGSLIDIDNCSVYQSNVTAKAKYGIYSTNVNFIGENNKVLLDYFATAPDNSMALKRNIAIAASSGTAVYTATVGGTNGMGLIEFYLTGVMGGTYTKPVTKRFTVKYALASNTLYDTVVGQTEITTTVPGAAADVVRLGDAEADNLTLTVAAVGADNQITLTFTNTHGSDAFAGQIILSRHNYYGYAIKSIE